MIEMMRGYYWIVNTQVCRSFFFNNQSYFLIGPCGILTTNKLCVSSCESDKGLTIKLIENLTLFVYSFLLVILSSAGEFKDFCITRSDSIILLALTHEFLYVFKPERATSLNSELAS